MLSWKSNHTCETFSSRNVLSNPGKNKEHCPVIPGTDLGVEQTATQTQMTCCCWETRSTEHVKRTPGHPLFELMDPQSTNQQSLGKLRECFQLVSERARERVVVGRKTTAFIVPCDTVERLPLTSFLHFLQSWETAHPIDAGSSGTSHAAESQSVCCTFEHYCCCKVIEIPDVLHRFSCFECGQELVDPLKPALVHKGRLIADPSFGGHSSFAQSTNKGEVARAVGQDLSFSMPDALTDACRLQSK